jgi:hypothetical protein
MFDWPPLRIHTITIAADLKANHAPTKRLEQHLGIGRIIAQIGGYEGIGIVATHRYYPSQLGVHSGNPGLNGMRI